MVYERPDGTKKFSWQKQLNFLRREHADDWESITHAKLMLLKQQHPDKIDYYDGLETQLCDRINSAMDSTSEFGFDHAQAITCTFLKDNNLESFFEDEGTPTYHYWCSRCENFTPHQPMENENMYCLTCHLENINPNPDKTV